MSLDRPPINPSFKDAAEHSPANARKAGTPPPFSIRLTPEEKSALKREAGSMPLGAYIPLEAARGSVPATPKPPQPGRGRKRRWPSFWASWARPGSRTTSTSSPNPRIPAPFHNPETEKAIQDACRDVQWMRARLIAALGLGS
jgi:hypothetical protein